MPTVSERPQPAPRPEKRAETTDLQQRYRAIGISAVAAAIGFRNDPEPADSQHHAHSRPRAA